MSEALLLGIDEKSTETLRTIKGIDGMLKTIIETHVTMAKAHSDIGNAFTMMAKTFDKVEQRQNKLEDTNTAMYKEKGIPPNIFFTVAATLCMVIILGAVWITNTFIKASLTTFEAGKKDISTAH